MPKVLLVDDNQEMLETLEHLFHFYEYEVEKAANGKEALEVAEKTQPDIILLDALMPVMNGFEACKQLKNMPRTRDIPVIFLSANYIEDEHCIMGLELGAEDYILKPFNAKELVTRVKAVLQKKALIEKLRQDNESLIQQQDSFSRELNDLRNRTSDLEKNLVTDALTGLYNKNFFDKRLKEEFNRARRYRQELSLVLIDLDFFNKINELYGERTGDYVLMKVANVILNNTRNSDIVFRTEGNKFALILPNTGETGAFYEAERVRSAVSQENFIEKGFTELKHLSAKRKKSYSQLTISAGVVCLAEQIPTVENLMKCAEDALAAAKAGGRNTVVKYAML